LTFNTKYLILDGHLDKLPTLVAEMGKEIVRLLHKGGITSPAGFKAAGVECGLKESGKDICAIYSERPASAAGVFTRNKVKAAPVKLCMERLKAGNMVQAIVVNSGNANACTGKQGFTDASQMARLAAKGLGVEDGSVLVASTGVIGQAMPMDKIRAGIEKALTTLSRDGGSDAALAIMTTDTRPKEMAVEVALEEGSTITIGGMAKGAGMIAPNMATMLSFITTDAAVEPPVLRASLVDAVDRSFNSMTVDGDTSTNDTVLLLANGLAGNRPIGNRGEDYRRFQKGLEALCYGLAKMIAGDGEGATKFVEISVKGAASYQDAKRVALSIANSSLVKTMLFGSDANWGRIMMAVGKAEAEVDEDRVDIAFGDTIVAKSGRAADFVEREVENYLKSKDVKITVDLNLGREEALAWTCDLSYDYVKINAEYRT